MDLSSTGSSISKYVVEDVFVKTYLKQIEIVDDNEKNLETKEKKVEKVKELTMDDFLDDFKL